MKAYDNIYDYVLAQEAAYKNPIPVYEDWSWSMSEHLKTSVFYKFGRLLTGNSDDKPVKNIIRPILNLAYRAEDIDVKDVTIYVDDPELYHLSFLVKKYHDDVFVKENDLDEFFDEVKEEKIDFGGALIQKMNGAKPQKVPLQSLAFCDQSNIMGAPFGIKMSFSPDELLRMAESGWGEKKNGATMSLKELIEISSYSKQKDKQREQKVETPGKYIDVYQIWGMLPSEFIDSKKEGEFGLQLHYVTFLKSDVAKDQKIGATLFKAFDKDTDRFKFVNRDKVYGRALGYGGVEELFEAQVWTNYSMIRKKDFLDSASKVIMQTADSTLVAKHPTGLRNLENLEVVEHEEGKPLSQVDTFPRNYQLFNNAVNEWEDYAQRTGAATDPLLGESPSAGTPFRLQERVVIEGKGLHEYRKEKYARFIEQVYNDWIIPHIRNKITNGVRFISELSSDEMEFIVNNMTVKEVNRILAEQIISGKLPTQEEVEQLKAETKQRFSSGGNKRFIEILKGELKNAKLRVKVDVASKIKDISGMVDRLSNVFKTIFANPQGFIETMKIPAAAKAFGKMIEYSGLDSSDFSSFKNETPITPIQTLQGVQAETPAVPVPV